MAYRQGGQCIPLPFSGYFANHANDIEMYGDTLYISGTFQDLMINGNLSPVPQSGLLKWYNDSLWAIPESFNGVPLEISAKGDSVLLSGGSYFNGNSYIYNFYLNSTMGWHNPFSIIHPTDTIGYYGATLKGEIMDNGDILVINNGSPTGNAFRGVSIWDGNQWHP